MASGANIIKKMTVRVYAAAVLLLVVWTGYTAVAYLFRSVFRPTHVPAKFLDWPGRLDTGALRAGGAAGVAQAAPRAPLGHYHGVDAWYQADAFEGCTTSGCHNPLPHSQRKELRAFANLHATFLTCQTCHAEPAEGTLAVTWVSTSTGERQGPPAILQLLRTFETQGEQVTGEPASMHETIVDLLERAIGVMNGDPLLEHLAVAMRTSEPGSPVWRRAVEQLSLELPNHARGEYGAKVAPEATASERVRTAGATGELARQYLAAAPDSAARKELHQKLHASVVAKPKGCVACHASEAPRVDFESLGYSPARAGRLRGAPIAHLMQQINEGQPFHLPSVLEGSDGR